MTPEETNDSPIESNEWDKAEEQALSAFEESEEGDAAEEPRTEEPVAEETSEPEEEKIEEPTQEQADEVLQPEGDDEPAEDPPADQKFNAEQWDGNPDSLPDDIRQPFDQVHRVMERGMHKKFQELASLRKEYEDKLAGLPGDQAPKPEPEAFTDAPPVPTADMTEAQQTEAWNKRDAYFAEKAIEKQAKESHPNEETAELLQEHRAGKRIASFRERHGFHQEVEVAMRQLCEAHPYYQGLFEDDEGMDVLFHTAQTALKNAELQGAADTKKQTAADQADAKIKKKASAAKGAIGRPGNTRDSSPADNFAAWGFEDAERDALEKLESGKY